MSDALRPQPAIPLSPPSPPADGVKEGSKSHFSDYTPHSPASPFMSVATKSYGQSFAETQASSGPTTVQRSPSPPISAPMSTQVSQQPSMTASTSFPTPDNSVIGQTRKFPDEFDDHHASKRQKVDNDINMGQSQEFGQDPSQIPDESRTTEVESGTTKQEFPKGLNISAGGDLLRLAAEEATQPANDEMSLEQLQKNVGEVFHLCKSGKILPVLCF
jgi:hypothetical protein